MALTPDGIDDFVAATLKLFKRRRWVDISLEHQEYCALSAMVKEKKVVERGGEQISWRVQVKNTGNAKNSGLYAVDTPKVEDVLQSANLPWRMQTTNYSYDIDEPEFQSDPETIVEILQVREHDAMNSFAELMEENLWNGPTGTSDDRPHGIPHWIVKDATTTPGGAFNGGNPAGFTAGAGGISSVTYPRWRNWTFGYSAVTTDDFLSKLRKSLAFTYFMAPDPFPELKEGRDPDHIIYTTWPVQEALERLAETRNDNLGNDLMRYRDNVVVKGIQVKWVPYLTANDSSDPAYGINWAAFRPYVRRNADMRRNPPKQAPHQRNVREVHIDHWSNYTCYNRRRLFVGSTS